jgi:hypothetical protein
MSVVSKDKLRCSSDKWGDDVSKYSHYCYL